MKRKSFYALAAFVACSLMFASCNGGSTPKASLKDPVDTLSYAYGVSLADQGLMQFLEPVLSKAFPKSSTNTK